jgi:hypothetical protein
MSLVKGIDNLYNSIFLIFLNIKYNLNIYSLIMDIYFIIIIILILIIIYSYNEINLNKIEPFCTKKSRNQCLSNFTDAQALQMEVQLL